MTPNVMTHHIMLQVDVCGRGFTGASFSVISGKSVTATNGCCDGSMVGVGHFFKR